MLEIFDPSDWCIGICKTIFAFFKPQFHFFFSARSLFSSYKRSAPNETDFNFFLYICCNFGQIFCTNVIHFFSVENMGHNQLKKCTKCHLVSLFNEKQGSTFANLLHLFYPLTLLTNSALHQKDDHILISI